MARIGLVAGYGRLPMIFSNAAKTRGDTVIAFGIKGVTQEDLPSHVDKMHWLEWGDFKKAILLLVTERIRKIVMLGKVEKNVFFKDMDKLDDKAKSMLEKIKDKKDSPILNEIAKVLKSVGVDVIDPTEYLKDLIPKKGTLTKREPSPDEWSDILYGKDVARELSKYDIGQTIAVKDKTVIALESVEGTDETIKRAGGHTKIGFVAIKVARPDQDMRFDVPMIGIDTLKTLIDSGGKVLAMEEGKTLLIDKEEMIKLADEKGISLVII